MKAEDVGGDWLVAFSDGWARYGIRGGIAAVAPLIAAAERERMAQRAFDQMSDDPAPGGWNDACTHIAAAIRARSDAP